MKKKIFASLFAIMLVLPMMVKAADFEIVYEKTYDEDCSGTICSIDIAVSLKNNSSDDLTISESDAFTITYTTAEIDTEYQGFVAGSTFTSSHSNSVVTLSLSDDNALGYTLAAGDTLYIGTFTFEYPNETDYDCSISLATKLGTYSSSATVTPDTNVQTGINIPLVALGVAGLIAVAVYVGISKKNKIYNV